MESIKHYSVKPETVPEKIRSLNNLISGSLLAITLTAASGPDKVKASEVLEACMQSAVHEVVSTLNNQRDEAVSAMVDRERSRRSGDQAAEKERKVGDAFDAFDVTHEEVLKTYDMCKSQVDQIQYYWDDVDIGKIKPGVANEIGYSAATKEDFLNDLTALKSVIDSLYVYTTSDYLPTSAEAEEMMEKE